MINRLLLFLIVLTVTAKAEIHPDKFIKSIWLNPPQVKENFVLAFKIRNDMLVFNKVLGDTFKAAVQIQLEVYNKKEFLVSRQILEANISCSDYEQTIAKNLFYSNKFMMSLPKEKLVAKLTIYDLNRLAEETLPPIEFSLTDDFTNYPIFILESDIKRIFTDSIFTQFTNDLPFSSNRYVMLLPFNDKTKKITISSKLFTKKIERINGYSDQFSIFDMNHSELFEGEYQITFEADDKTKVPFKVIWYSKPEYLNNLTNSIRLMRYAFEENVINSLSSLFGEENYLQFLMTWKRIDPTPGTAFNELMNEFYVRADYARDNFRSITVQDGALSDRGKVYILYGTPKSIQRTFSQNGKATEIWNYEGSINHQFIFVDEQKNGNLILKK